jgi:hypothetical protein
MTFDAGLARKTTMNKIKKKEKKTTTAPCVFLAADNLRRQLWGQLASEI